VSILERTKALFAGVVPGSKGATASSSEALAKQSEAENTLASLLLDRFRADTEGGNQAHERYGLYLERWRRRYRLPDRASWRSNVNTGAEFASIETQVSILTATPLRLEIRPKSNPKLAVLAPFFQSMFDDWSERHHFQDQIERAVRISLLNSWCDSKTGWDPEFGGGEGDPVVTITDPRNVYVDQEATSFHGRKRYTEIEWFTAEEMSVLFGRSAEGLSSQNRYYDSGLGMASEAEGTSQLQKIRVIRVWWEDLSRERVEVPFAPQEEAAPLTIGEDEQIVEVEDNTSSEEKLLDKESVWVRKYPSGRVTTLTDEGIILDDRPNPYPDWPHNRLYNYADPHMATGISEMDLTREIQDVIDTFLSNASDHMEQHGNYRMILESSTGIDPDQVTGAPGEIFVPNAGTGQTIRWMEPPPLQEWVVQIPELMRRWHDNATGVQDVIRGERPAGLETFATLRALEDSGLSRIKPKAKRLREFVRQIALRVIYMFQTRYTTPRKLRVSGDKGEKLVRILTENQEFIAENSGLTPDEDGFSPEDAIRYLGQSGKDFYFEIIGIGMKGAMDIEVQSGRMIEKTQAEIEATALELSREGHIDTQDLLEKIDWPAREGVLERVGQLQQAQAQIEQLTAALQEMQNQIQGQGQGQAFQGAPGGSDPLVAPIPGAVDAGPLDPDQENQLLADGQLLVTHPEDDIAQHIQVHTVAMQQAPGEVQPVFAQHIQMHQGRG